MCLLANSSTNSKEGEMQLLPNPNAPFETIHVDHFGPLPTTEDGYKHIMVILDAFTCFIYLRPVKTTNAQETCAQLQLLFEIFGLPKNVVSDRGTAFTSNEFASFLESRRVYHRKVAVASPWANGLAKRVNRFLKSSLMKSVEEPADWKLHLAKIQYVINNTYCTAIKSTPSKLMLGYDQRSHLDCKLSEFIDQWSCIESNWQEAQDTNRMVAAEATDQIRQYNKLYYDKRHKKPTQYNIGDYVLVRELQMKPGQSKKLKPKYKGPYQIAKILNNNRYVIQDIPGFNVTSKPYNSIMSPDKFKPWIKPLA